MENSNNSNNSLKIAFAKLTKMWKDVKEKENATIRKTRMTLHRTPFPIHDEKMSKKKL